MQKDTYAKVDSLMQVARQSSPFETEPVTTQIAQDAYQSQLPFDAILNRIYKYLNQL